MYPLHFRTRFRMGNKIRRGMTAFFASDYFLYGPHVPTSRFTTRSNLTHVLQYRWWQAVTHYRSVYIFPPLVRPMSCPSAASAG